MKLFYFKRNPDNHAIHESNVPRIGGLILIISLFFISIGFSINFILIILLVCSPLILITFIEDVLRPIDPLVRFFAISISALIYLSFFPGIEEINSKFLFDLNTNKYFLFILSFVAIVSVTNSFNLIDGLNGLLALSTIFILFSICLQFFYFESITIHSDDYLSIIVICFSLVILLFFNFPSQKIFFGDLGAYFLGFFVSIFTIRLMNTNMILPSWLAVLILIYPITETIFSVIRRMLSHKKVFSPDNQHLHHLIYSLVLKRCNLGAKTSNNFSTVILIPFAIYGPFLAIYFRDIFSLFVLILLFIFIYTFFYFFCYFLVNK